MCMYYNSLQNFATLLVSPWSGWEEPASYRTSRRSVLSPQRGGELGTQQDTVGTHRKYGGLKVGELGDGGLAAWEEEREWRVDYFYNLGRFKEKKGLGEQFRKQAIAQKIEQEKGKGRES